MSDTPKPENGTWTLISPSGRQWAADSPLRVCSLEQRERVPADVALERIKAACTDGLNPFTPEQLAYSVGCDYDTEGAPMKFSFTHQQLNKFVHDAIGPFETELTAANAKIADLEKLLATEKERADYAWKNTYLIQDDNNKLRAELTAAKGELS